MPRRLLIVLSFAVLLPLAAGSGGASTSDRAAGATARGYGIQIVIPGDTAKGTPTLSAPQDAVQFGGAFAYPEDGSIASVATVTLSVSASSGPVAGAAASAELSAIKLFNGEITADALSAKATGNATPDRASGDLSQASATNLVVLGQPVTAAPNQRVELGDWGYLLTLEQSTAEEVSGAPGFRGFVTVLDVHLTADHGGLVAGSEILAGYAEANVQTPTAPPLPVPPASKRVVPDKAKPGTRKPPEPKDNGIPLPIQSPPNVTPKLTAGGYVFPVYGPTSFGDSFGAPRADVSYHHGDDLFAPLGAPLLACASGTVFSVGWNRIGGNRLWLRDAQGNQFYYAHLSAFSPLAKNGAHVNAGDVIGFVGTSGDAEGTPSHLHFEIHPVGLLGLGYDGAVNPTSYLEAWQRLEDVPITAAGAWAPMPAAGTHAPKAGAILLQVSDISSASGLDPASLQRAVAPVSSEGDGALIRAG